MIFWVNNDRYLDSYLRQQQSLPVDALARPAAGYENPPGVSTDQRVRNFLDGDRAAWYNHVNLNAHDGGGHFILWEIPDEWVAALRNTFRGRR